MPSSTSRRRLTRWTLAAAAGVALATTTVAAGAGAHPARPGSPPAGPHAAGEQRVHGSAGGELPTGFGEWTGDPVAFALDAHGMEGTFEVSHRKPDGTDVAAFTGDITCLAVGGDVAVATGVITEGTADIPGRGEVDLAGERVSFTVLDDGRKDRFFWQWGFLGAPVADCQGTAPLFDPSWGGFEVSGEML